MTSINLYQTTKANLYKSACILLSKCYKEALKTLVITDNQENALMLDNLLWTFSQKSFIPHALSTDQFFDEHPIIISDTELQEAGFNTLMLVEKFEIQQSNYQKILALFTEKDLQNAKNLQKSVTPSNTNYYIQNEVGEWQKATI
jgi:DNA polymerase-3 subunit chi